MKQVSPTSNHHKVHRAKPTLLLAAGVVVASLPALACAWAGTGTPLTSLQTTNAYWNCPTRTPRPTVTPVPTACIEATGTPNASGTPGPVELRCEDPKPTATPWPTVTPYGRWMSPLDRGSSNTFYLGQDVRIGKLKLTLESYKRSGPIPNTGGQVAHIFTIMQGRIGSASTADRRLTAAGLRDRLRPAMQNPALSRMWRGPYTAPAELLSRSPGAVLLARLPLFSTDARDSSSARLYGSYIVTCLTAGARWRLRCDQSSPPVAMVLQDAEE